MCLPVALDFRFSRPDDHEQIQDVFDDGFVFSRSQLTGEWIPEVQAANGLLVGNQIGRASCRARV